VDRRHAYPARPRFARARSLKPVALTLHRSPLDPYAEKARATLDFKGLQYDIVDHPARADMVAIRRLHLHEVLPALDHDGDTVRGATAIALHVERAFPAKSGFRALLPDDIRLRREALDLDARIEAILGEHAPLLLYESALHDRVLFDRIAATVLPPRVSALTARSVGFASRAAFLLPAPRRRLEEAHRAVVSLLAELLERLTRGPYLLGHSPTLPDVGAAALSMFLKFPTSQHIAHPELSGRGVSRFLDDPRWVLFFQWRDGFYRDFLR